MPDCTVSRPLKQISHVISLMTVNRMSSGEFGIKKLATCDSPGIDLIGDEMKLVPAS
jgi:hypothetical protein